MPLLPLDTFRRILAFHPYHFWQFSNSVIPITSKCNSLVYQSGWQNTDATGRDEVAQAIEHAERRLSEYLDFTPAPAFRSDTLAWPEYVAHNMRHTGYADAAGRWMTVQLDKGMVQAVGTETLTLIDTVDLDYSTEFADEDGDGLKEVAIITVTVPAAMSADELRVYVGAADRYDGSGVSERWRVNPVIFRLSGTTATIRMAAWLLAKPIRQQGFASQPLDPTDVNVYVSSVDVYRSTVDTSSQATLIWETAPFPYWCRTQLAEPHSSDPASLATASARVGIRNARSGLVTPAEAVYNATTGEWYSVLSWGRPPDRVTVNYLAGVELQDGNMAPEWAMIVTRLAAAEMPGPVSGCKEANRELYRWQVDLARTDSGGGDAVLGAVSPTDLDNPFGTRRGHVYAWREVQQRQLLYGILAR